MSSVSLSGLMPVRTADFLPDNPLHILQNQLAPVWPNTAVKFAFYGGLKQQADPNYAERLSCSRADMRPQLVSLEASWGLFTSYGFNVATDVPFTQASGPNSAYYSIIPTSLRTKLVAEDPRAASAPTVTFRAEYKCFW